MSEVTEEIWRTVPPEEKLELLAKSHARGVWWGLAVMLIGGTLGIAFQEKFLFWSSILASPIVVQFASSRRWRFLRPKTVLEYLAARSVARRYAYAVKANDLDLKLMFRGTVQEIENSDNPLAMMEARVGTEKIECWIALFGDSVIIMSEQKGGADLEFGHVINHRFKVETKGDEESGYSHVQLHYDDARFGMHSVELTSQYPAALLVFTKKLEEALENPRGARPEPVAGAVDLSDKASDFAETLQQAAG